MSDPTGGVSHYRAPVPVGRDGAHLPVLGDRQVRRPDPGRGGPGRCREGVAVKGPQKDLTAPHHLQAGGGTLHRGRQTPRTLGASLWTGPAAGPCKGAVRSGGGWAPVAASGSTRLPDRTAPARG